MQSFVGLRCLSASSSCRRRIGQMDDDHWSNRVSARHALEEHKKHLNVPRLRSGFRGLATGFDFNSHSTFIFTRLHTNLRHYHSVATVKIANS